MKTIVFLFTEVFLRIEKKKRKFDYPCAGIKYKNKNITLL